MRRTVKKKSKKHLLHFEFIKFACSCATVLLLALALNNINSYLSKSDVLGTSTDTENYEVQKEYWKKIVLENPTYISGYLELAKLELDLGNKNNAVVYFDSARKIDPNNLEVITLEASLR